MRRHSMMTAVMAAAVTLAALGTAAAGAAGAATPALRVAPGAQLWAARYNGPAGNNSAENFPSSMAVSPGGSRVFVTGYSTGATTGDDYATVAYSAATGRQLWVRRYNGPGNTDDGLKPDNSTDTASSVAVSPAGSRVFVTGSSDGRRTGSSACATVAYSAATGRQLWVSRYNGPANFCDASSAAVSPAGSTVFVTGASVGARTGWATTVAYSAATGRQLWVSRYNGPANSFPRFKAVTVSLNGQMVFVTGSNLDGTAGYVTVAYSAATGRQLWARGYISGSDYVNMAVSMTVSPGGTRVFVTGSSFGRFTGTDVYATVAYRAATGRQLWVRRYYGSGDAAASSVAVSPGGARVYVTGASSDYATTVAYSSATGRQLWVSRYSGHASTGNSASAVAVSPAGTTVYVTGFSTGRTTGDDYATVAYSSATGRQLWATRYNGPGNGDDYACCAAVSPGGTRLYVTGSSFTFGWPPGYDYATIAYRS